MHRKTCKTQKEEQAGSKTNTNDEQQIDGHCNFFIATQKLNIQCRRTVVVPLFHWTHQSSS